MCIRDRLQTEARAPWPRIDTLTVSAQGLSSREQAPVGTWLVQAQDQHGAKVSIRGQGHVAQGRAEHLVSLQAVQMVPWLAPVRPALALPVNLQQGAVSADLQLLAQAPGHTARLTPQMPWPAASTGSGPTAATQAPLALEGPGLLVANGRISIEGLKAQKASPTPQGLPIEPEHLAWRRMDLEGLQGWLSAVPSPTAPPLRFVRLGTLAWEGLDARLTRPAPSSTPPAPVAVRTGNAQPNTTAVDLGQLRCQDCQLAVRDARASEPGVNLVLQRIELQTGALSNDLQRPIRGALQASTPGQGKLAIEGEVRPAPLSARLKLLSLIHI